MQILASHISSSSVLYLLKMLFFLSGSYCVTHSTIMNRRLASLLAAFFLSPATLSSQHSFPVVTTVDEPTIAGRPVALDAQHKLLPWPMPDDTGYSYSSHVLSQWAIVWD